MAYTEVTLAEASEVIKKAGFRNLLSIEKLKGGWANSNYKLILEDQTKLVLKIWNEQSQDEVNYLLNITSFLVNSGIPTPKPIVFDNEDFLIMKDGLPWTILPFVDGNWLGYDYDSLFSLGVIQAKMHLIGPPNNLKSDFSMGKKLFEKLLLFADVNEDNNVSKPEFEGLIAEALVSIVAGSVVPIFIHILPKSFLLGYSCADG